MNKPPTRDWDDTWGLPSSPYQPIPTQELRPRLPIYEEPPGAAPYAWDSIGNLRERIAKLEVGARHQEKTGDLVITHQQEALRLIADRLQGAVQRLQTADERLHAVEAQIRENGTIIAESKPIIEQFKRGQDRKKLLKDVTNWVAAGAVIYLAASGRIVWGDAVRALGRMLGVV